MGRLETDPVHEIKMREWEKDVDWRAAMFSAHTGAISALSTIALNSIVLANSAAAGAVLVLLSTLWGKPAANLVADPAFYCLAIFASGVAAAIVAAGLGYLCQLAYGHVDIHRPGGRLRVFLQRAAVTLQFFSIVAGFVGVLSFAFGAYHGLKALEAARPEFVKVSG